jgi:hypothetical protein
MNVDAFYNMPLNCIHKAPFYLLCNRLMLRLPEYTEYVNLHNKYTIQISHAYQNIRVRS